jgi:hypothetical protein
MSTRDGGVGVHPRAVDEARGRRCAWWTKGDYFGDKTIAFAIPCVEAAEGSVRLA